MATVTVYTAARMKAIEDNSIVSGRIDGDDLILTKHNLTEVNAGNVRGDDGGTIICTSATRPATPTDGLEIYETDTKRSYIYNTDIPTWIQKAGPADWHFPSFTNSWIDSFGGPIGSFAPLQYCVIDGVVYMEGSVRNGAIGYSAFTLPGGYRPGVFLRLATLDGFGHSGYVDIFPSGTVTPMVGNNALYLMNFSFRTD